MWEGGKEWGERERKRGSGWVSERRREERSEGQPGLGPVCEGFRKGERR